MFVGSLPWLGVAFALVSAFLLAVANLWQSKGMRLIAAKHSGAGSFGALIKTPIWLFGTLVYGLSIILQMASLAFAPLILVQPIGVSAIVFTAMLTARATGHPPTTAAKQAIGITLVGVVSYVIIAAIVSKQQAITDDQLVEMMVTLVAVLIVAGIALLATHGGARVPMLYVVIGGVFSGFVATLGKTVILRVESMFSTGSFVFGTEGWLTVLCAVGIAIAAAVSAFFVQYAHTCNSPESVVAGLTVIDPAVAVILGITILQEAAGAPIWTTFAFLVAGAVSFVGVWKLAVAEDGPSKGSAVATDSAEASQSKLVQGNGNAVKSRPVRSNETDPRPPGSK